MGLALFAGSVYTVTEIFDYEFADSDLYLTVLCTAPVVAGLLFLRNVEARLQVGGILGAALRFVGRQTLIIYAIHLMLLYVRVKGFNLI